LPAALVFDEYKAAARQELKRIKKLGLKTASEFGSRNLDDSPVRIDPAAPSAFSRCTKTRRADRLPN